MQLKKVFSDTLDIKMVRHVELRVYQVAPQVYERAAIVLMRQVRNGDGITLTNGVEYVADYVVREILPGWSHKDIIWIQESGAEEFQILFDKKVIFPENPIWRRMSIYRFLNEALARFTVIAS